MHGRKKAVKPPTEEERAVTATKVVKYRALEAAVLEMRAAKLQTSDALAGTAKLLSVNPDFYSIWNYRREVLLAVLSTTEADDAKLKLFQDELELTVAALKRNPKSYCAWHHRQWVVIHGKMNLEVELGLCTQFLTLDQRNFHCWSYRMWVANVAGVEPAAEFEFTTEKIRENFSNYSAWHFRSKLLPRLGPVTVATLAAELALVQQATFTEPADQSAWFYHRWLLSQCASLATGAEADAAVDLLVQEVKLCFELWEVEEHKCKWPLLAVVYVYKLIGARSGEALAAVGCDRDAITTAAKDLIALDPAHTRCYSYMCSV